MGVGRVPADVSFRNLAGRREPDAYHAHKHEDEESVENMAFGRGVRFPPLQMILGVNTVDGDNKEQEGPHRDQPLAVRLPHDICVRVVKLVVGGRELLLFFGGKGGVWFG